MYIEKPQSFISTHPFSDVSSFSKYLNPQVRTNKLANSVVYHLCPSKLASGIHLCFFKLLRVLSLSRMLVEFSLTCIFHHVWEKFSSLWYSHYKMHWIYAFLLMPQTPTHISRYNFLKICFPQEPRTKGWMKLWFALLKLNHKIWRWLGTLVYLYFV